MLSRIAPRVAGVSLFAIAIVHSPRPCEAADRIPDFYRAMAAPPTNPSISLLGTPPLEAYVKASNTGTGDQFGIAIAASGDTLVVGAWNEDSSATGVGGNQADNTVADSGAVYVFVRSGIIWSQQAYIKASNTQAGDWFGGALAIDGDTLVVGAIGEDSNATGVGGNEANNSASLSGAAYVFTRTGTVWSQQAYLKASNTGSGDRFGASVAISGDTIVVGAFNEDSNATGINGDQANNSASNSGAAYVFTRNGFLWTQQAYLKASNTGTSDTFGDAVAISGDTIVVGADGEDSNATGINGDGMDNSASGAGAAYVFIRSGVLWSQQAYVKASNTETFDQFGYSVAVDGDTVVVGAIGEASNATGVGGNQADNSLQQSGAAYVFVRNGGNWSQQAYLKASNTGEFYQFGRSAAASGDHVLVASAGENDGIFQLGGVEAGVEPVGAGAAYFYSRAASVWSFDDYITAFNREANDQFGHSVALTSDLIAAGAPFEDSNATGTGGNQADNSASAAGAVYLYSLASCLTLGDMNCDCGVDLGDVGPFVMALLDATAYDSAYPSCEILNADMQPDGNINGADVQGFVDLLLP